MNRKITTILSALLLAAVSFYFASSNGDTAQSTQPATSLVAIGGDAAIAAAFRERRSDIEVETRGTVIKLLPDDTRGSRHQRFILRLGSGQTVLVSHNIDLAPRIDALKTGDELSLRGEYEWNERGGVVHWTHHDPQGRRTGGWIRHRDRIYQ
ncbi:MAG: DUF3465 domain-containing protein [Pseudomonadota bacterium]